MVVELLGSCRL